MRLTKTIYIIHENKEIADYDPLGNPIYKGIKSYHPISCEIEPFGSEMSEKSYGVFVKATNRVFSKPNSLLKLDGTVKYKDDLYKITKVIEYDKHTETLLNYIGGDVDE